MGIGTLLKLDPRPAKPKHTSLVATVRDMRKHIQKQTAKLDRLEAELSLFVSESLALDAKDPALPLLRTCESELRTQLKTLKDSIARTQELLHLVVQGPLFTIHLP